MDTIKIIKLFTKIAFVYLETNLFIHIVHKYIYVGKKNKSCIIIK